MRPADVLAADADLGDLVYVLIQARRGNERFRRKRDLAAHLDVAVSTLNDWEAGRDAPTLLNLIRWARVFNLRLALCDEHGDCLLFDSPAESDQAWVAAEAQHLLTCLGQIRTRLLITQLGLAGLLGVTGATVLRWEHDRRHPRLLVLLRWTRKLGRVVQLRPISPPSLAANQRMPTRTADRQLTATAPPQTSTIDPTPPCSGACEAHEIGH